ncbi:MAG: long-chain-fatty-acid--CoA ligase [Spongiibacter sp.]
MARPALLNFCPNQHYWNQPPRFYRRPCTTEQEAPMYIQEMIEFNAREYSDHIALRTPSQSLSYGKLEQRCNQLANGLLASGLQAGDRVALLSKNNLAYLQVVIACMKAGLILVPLNYRLAPAELSYILTDSDAAMLIVGDNELRDAASKCEAIATLDRCYAMSETNADWRAFEELFSANTTRPPRSTLSAENNDVIQMYTSGTTGYPKGVLFGHRQLLNAYVMTAQVPERCQVGHLGIMPLPLFHVAGMAASLVWLCGGAIVEVTDDFNPLQLVQSIVGSTSCDTVLVPAMIQAVLAFVPNIESYDFSPLQRITYGASPISMPILQQAMEIFGCDFVQGFGMTELSCMVLCLQASDHRRALAGNPQLLRSCGRPLPGAELKVLKDNGEEAAPGETGELLIRSATVMSGYWKQPEKTAATLVDGWLHTGDAGYVDEDGFFYIRDRLKDMIVSGGENIYPAEIENTLFSHPAIQDVAVIAVPDEKFGEAALAVCVLKPDTTVTDEDLVAFCRERLAGYKIPRRYAFVDELPRNPSGKILKRVLREPYWQDSDRQVG